MKPEKKVLKVAIADDEPLAREGIRQLLAMYDDVKIVGEASDGIQAVELVEEKKPDLVFLDIQMPELDGFGVVTEIGVDAMPTTIFVTAFDEFALKAFEVHAFDYLLKPIEADRFAEALDRARSQALMKDDTVASDKLRKLIESISLGRPALQRLAIKSSGKISFVNTQDIDWIQANGDYVWVNAQGKKLLLREKISDLHSKLDQNVFARIHRSTIVNISRIKDLEPMFYGDYTVNLLNGTKLTLSRSYREKLFSILHLSR